MYYYELEKRLDLLEIGNEDTSITQFVGSPTNELHGSGFRYIFHSQESVSLYKERGKVQ